MEIVNGAKVKHVLVEVARSHQASKLILGTKRHFPIGSALLLLLHLFFFLSFFLSSTLEFLTAFPQPRRNRRKILQLLLTHSLKPHLLNERTLKSLVISCMQCKNYPQKSTCTASSIIFDTQFAYSKLGFDKLQFMSPKRKCWVSLFCC